MSQWRRRLEETTELESAGDWIADNYQVPVVALLFVFMLWSRLRSWQRFVVDGRVLFRGQDAWYHYRTVSYTVRNWPATMPFDPWTYFPYGNASGQFGTLFDQIIATAALVVGLGSPDQQTIGMTLLVAPAVFGAVAVIPTYFIGRRMGGKVGGITAVAVLAFSTGQFFARSLVGFSDHHVAEALFQALGILGVMIAVTVANRDKPIYEQIEERDFQTLRPTLVWSAIAGLAITLYLWVWPFGVLLVGIVGAFLLVQMNIEVVHGKSPEHTAFAGATMFSVVGIAMLSSVQTADLTASDYSLLHPLAAFTVAFGSLFMAWLAREWEARDIDRTLYPLAILGIIVAGVMFMAVFLPEQFNYFIGQLQRIFGLGFYTSQRGATVGEVQPLVNWDREGLGAGIQQLFSAYGFALFAAVAGTAIVAVRTLLRRDLPAEQLLIVVWVVFMTAATFTQNRFQYYLIFPVAVLTGYAVSIVVDWIDLDAQVDSIETYQVLVVLATVLLILGPIAPTALAAGQYNGPGQGVQGWSDGLEWMEENTPKEGAFNESDGNLEYYGTYPRTDDHDYDSGEYGVLSWWDYGHFITTIGERIPTANPFQQGATTAANFLLAPNESQANDVLNDVSEEDAKTRYIMVDYKMVDTYNNFGGKFFAPTDFYNNGEVAYSDYTDRIYYDINRSAYFRLQTQEFYNATSVRLYQHHGSAVEPEPYVIDWGTTQVRSGITVPTVPPEDSNSTTIRRFESMSAAREYVENDSTSRIGGIGGKPSKRVPAMEHYRLVGASDQKASQSSNYNRGVISTAQALFGRQAFTIEQSQSDCTSGVSVPGQNGGHICLSDGAAEFLQPSDPRWTKTFERVPGATVQGNGPENTTVTATVEMQMPGSDETFTYHQRAQTGDDGQFTMTLPYSTTGYDNWGPEEGHTNVSVRANSSYRFQAAKQVQNGTVYSWSDTADVSEGQVIGENDSTTTVDMERSVLFEPGEQNSSSNTTENTSGNETSGLRTDASTETNDGSNDSETSGDTAGSLVPPMKD